MHCLVSQRLTVGKNDETVSYQKMEASGHSSTNVCWPLTFPDTVALISTDTLPNVATIVTHRCLKRVWQGAKENCEFSSNQWCLDFIFKLTRGREIEAGWISITTSCSHHSKLSVFGGASLNEIATATTYVGIIWVVVPTACDSSSIIDSACISALALGGVTNNLTQ